MKKKLEFLILLSILSFATTGCGTSAFDNAETYFSQVSSVMKTWTANPGNDAAEEKEIAKKLDTPGSFVVDEEGNYSFIGVENADYYLVYFCSPEATNDSDAYLYTSSSIQDSGTSGDTYKGNVADLMDYGYGEYLVKVFAFPKVNDVEHAMSTAASTYFTNVGELSTPEIEYLWNAFDNTVDIQIGNIEQYVYEVYPDSVDVTFTNAEDNTDSTVITLTDLSAECDSLVADTLTRGVTYNVSAIAKSDSPYVTNMETSVMEVVQSVTFGENNVMSENYYYTDGILRDTFTYPQVCENFNLEEGGDMNEEGISVVFTFTAIPTAANEGAAYSYKISGNWVYSTFEDGYLDLYEDGTFLMGKGMEMAPEEPTKIQGIWRDNGDGTAILSFDHSTLERFSE